ncbi:MAG TPA: hypothetical protein VHR66_20415 [Gemmataceae bacterium]|jgi:hypothetical protein|nr:hypothetical protein [Gemmataceae bacterium]
MIRMWSVRLLTLGGLILALGCRSHPTPPSLVTPLLPGDTSALPPKLVELPPMTSPQGAQLSTKTSKPTPTTKIPDVRWPETHLPSFGPDELKIVPPPDVKPPLSGQPVTGPMPREQFDPSARPVIKPLLIEAPRPPAGPDGFAPAPIIPLPAPPAPPQTAKPPLEEVKSTPPLPAGEKFGHGPDYRWIAGVLDKHQRGGTWTIRFADAGTDDPWGGKVRLLASENLAGFDSGDVVYLEGELLAPRNGSDNTAYPPYRVTTVRLIEKGR